MQGVKGWQKTRTEGHFIEANCEDVLFFVPTLEESDVCYSQAGAVNFRAVQLKC